MLGNSSALVCLGFINKHPGTRPGQFMEFSGTVMIPAGSFDVCVCVCNLKKNILPAPGLPSNGLSLTSG